MSRNPGAGHLDGITIDLDLEVRHFLRELGNDLPDHPPGSDLIIDNEAELLREVGWDSSDFARFLGDQYDLPLIERLDSSKIDPRVIQKISRRIARLHGILPLFEVNGRLVVAISTPRVFPILNHLSRQIRTPIDPVIASSDQINTLLNELYSEMDQIRAMRSAQEDAGDETNKAIYNLETHDDGEEADGGSVIKSLDLILIQGIKDGVSDIHFDPDDDHFVVRFRVAGVLQDVKRFLKKSAPEFISRIKILSGLDIAETRLPQDGRIGVHCLDRRIDFRVSTLPTVKGEKAVLRILDKGHRLLSLESLHFIPEIKGLFTEIINIPYGVFLITGPTGSGKTTTLYSALNAISTREKNFITFEDPVEYQLKGINQVQIMPKAGLTFASGLKACLRQDPDVILVGEVRDQETAEICFNAALTGHFVFSTFHTNDAPSAIARLRELDIEPFLIASALVGVNAQRLVRRICESCKTPFPLDDAQLARLGIPHSFDDASVFQGTGCRECGGSGYRRQEAIFELMRVEDEIRTLILNGASTRAILERARSMGMLTLYEYGVIKALQGITTIDEVLRVATDDR